MKNSINDAQLFRIREICDEAVRRSTIKHPDLIVRVDNMPVFNLVHVSVEFVMHSSIACIDCDIFEDGGMFHDVESFDNVEDLPSRQISNFE